MRYSIFSLVRNAATFHENWPLAWRSPAPKRSYDAVVIGGGIKGCTTALHLAEAGMRVTLEHVAEGTTANYERLFSRRLP